MIIDLLFLNIGIKTGRYTYEKRTNDFLEVQRLKKIPLNMMQSTEINYSETFEQTVSQIAQQADKALQDVKAIRDVADIKRIQQNFLVTNLLLSFKMEYIPSSFN